MKIVEVDRNVIGSNDVVVTFDRDITDEELLSFRETVMALYAERVVNYRCLTCFHQRSGERPVCFKDGSACKIVEV